MRRLNTAQKSPTMTDIPYVITGVGGWMRLLAGIGIDGIGVGLLVHSGVRLLSL